MPRLSLHHEPVGLRNFLRHYIGDVVYGANDGIITTFAVIASVTGGALSARTVLVVGTANLLADGISMGVGNYLSIRSREGAREAMDLPEEEGSPVRHGAITFLAFALAGAIPMAPYVFGFGSFGACASLTLASLFAVGSMRSLVTVDRWWMAGLEMLGLGVIVAALAYACGAVVTRVLA